VSQQKINELDRRQLLTRGGVWLLVGGLGGCKFRGESRTADRLPPSTEPSSEVVVYPAVKPIKQISNNTCWAAAWTMIKSWKDNKTFSTEAAVRALGPEWLGYLNQDLGLEAQTFTEQGFIDASHLNAKPPANYLPSVYVDLLASKGPLWINTGDGILNHAMLMVSAQTTQAGRIRFRFADPQSGTFLTKSDETFFKEFEQEARYIMDRKLEWDFRFQIFHW
jgi:Papain-like cysteine protease AvrRpt2